MHQPERSEVDSVVTLYTIPVQILYPGAGGPGVNTWHCRTTGTDNTTNGELQSIVDLVHTFYTDLRPVYTPGTTLSFLGTCTGTTDHSFVNTEADPWTVTGQASQGVLLPAAAQIVVGWTTSDGTRSGKGRTFVGPLCSSTLETASDGTPTAGTVTLLQNVALGLVSSSEGFADGALGVWSPTDQVFRDFTGAHVRKTYAVLTSRRD